MSANSTPKTSPAISPEVIRKKILLVDDNPQIRKSLQKVLYAEGYDVVVLAAEGREGIEKFDTEQIDLLLLDVILPDISGWDVFGTVTSRNPSVPVIIITGRNEQQQLEVLSEVGTLVEKPPNVLKPVSNIAETLAEPPGMHLKQLRGLPKDLRHVKPTPPASQKAESFISMDR